MFRHWRVSLAALLLTTTTAGIGWSIRTHAAEKAVSPMFPPGGPVVPRGLVPVFFPADNPYTPEKAELGWLLYFDKRISADGTLSCATCHDPKLGWGDGRALPKGIKDQTVPRHSPTIINRAFSVEQFWDGRSPSLEEQAKGPVANSLEMGNTLDNAVKTVRGVPGYRERFKKVFGTDELTIDHMVKAIATFERTVLSGNSPYDRFKAGETDALTSSQQNGMKIFFSNKARCDSCHEGINFTAGKFTNIGIGMDKPNPDLGRYNVTKKEEDKGAFKTPTLRDVALSGPYMHDGSIKTLEEVVEHYSKGGIPNKWLHQDVRKLDLTEQEKKDLVAFLKSLTGTEGWQHIKPPTTFPQ
jgi:cytochrome c peroxidase